MSATVRRSVCPYDCPDACGMLVTVENGRAVSVAGDPDHPYTRGLLCPKMIRYEQTVHSPRRLTTPLLRQGAKGDGAFTAITWDEAIERICSRWQELIATHGAECILPYSYAGTMGLVQRNAGHPFFHYLGASRLDRTICSPAKDAGWKAVMGDTPGLDPGEMAESDLIILWGINAVATSIHCQRDVQEARRRGAGVWAIDTWRTPTLEAADESFVVRPGGDGALALGMMHVLTRNGLVDHDFIRGNVAGFDEFAATVLPDCAPARMAPVCGLAEEDIERLARAYAAARAPFIRLGSGLTRYGNGAMTVRTITCLPALIGAWQRPGAGLLCGTTSAPAFPLSPLLRENFSPRPTRLINMNRLGEALTRLNDPPVMSLYVYHSNPASVTPDQNAVLEGLSRPDLFTVVHERFLTDTARYADIVLPATSSLEYADLYRSYGTYIAQRCDAAIPPVGESKPNWEVFSLLARGMGWNEPFFRQTTDGLIDLLIDQETAWRGPVANERLRRGEPVPLTVPTSARGGWLTPSGKIEILNPLEPETLPCLLPTHAAGDGLPLLLQSAPTPYALNASFYERDDLRQKQACMALLMHPDDAEQRGLADGERVAVGNQEGEALFMLTVTERVPAGTVVTEGVWWGEFIDGKRGVNTLTSQRLTDRGNGSTLYDVAVEVRKWVVADDA
ncbi:molybdopterin-dependent oxidoreductase [Geobacter argillaceus]|uniref:Anaerobic selenocysteine-containing dehydrogenase n=1 Tax=Geobacter argillaceus TaxID=345631 RepID=A0A562WSJ7_9BACT|nr:molybdopterin-dependent oxidoreductase [Geobacter argillaceus]TWJ33565.1 anaerobic selenocysteine-containing dehydrogenase [Geobacter argillaceus]